MINESLANGRPGFYLVLTRTKRAGHRDSAFAGRLGDGDDFDEWPP